MDLSEDQLQALKALAAKPEQLDSDRRALVEEMAKQYKIPIAKPKGMLDDLADMAKTATLPMLGQLGFGLAGAPAGPAGIVAGEITGALIGTKANEMLGISKPDELDYALSGGAPLIGAGIGKMARRLIPGGSAAEQGIGAERMKAMPSTLDGSRDATNQAYAQIGNAPLSVPAFTKTVQDLLGTEQTMKKYGVQSPQVKRAMDTTMKTLVGNPTGIPMTEVNGLLKRYREKVAGLETKGGEQYGAYKALRQSLFADMDASIAGKTGTDALLLRQAMGEAKKQIAKEEFTELLAQHGSKMATVLGQTFEVIQPTKVLNKLRDIGFEQSVGKQTYAKIEQTLKELAKIPHPAESMKTGIGSEGRAIAMTGAAVLGAAAGAESGPHGIVGGGVGSALLTYGAIKTHDAVARLMMSDSGRKFLTKMFKHNQGRIGERTSQVLQFAADQFQDTGDLSPQRDQQISRLADRTEEPSPDEARRERFMLTNPVGPSLRQG